MCTYLRDTELDVQIAEKDIEVYKIVKIKHYKWYAPCMDVPYESKELSSKLGTPKKLKYDLVESNLHSTNVGLYSYAYKIDAVHAVSSIIGAYKDEALAVVKAIIPKNSRYYRSTVNDEIYVSDHLNLGEIIYAYL